MSKLQFEYRPIDAWPGERTKTRQPSQFKAPLTNTLDLLDRELTKVGARNIVFQCDVDAADIRLDGMLRAGVKPRSPAVILSFDSRHGPLSYPCDRFNDWKDKLAEEETRRHEG
jgi:hypothetical protein